MQFRKPKPIFKQIAEYVIELIITDQWQAGKRIPSVREFAAEADVNANTIARTYGILNDKEIIYTERGVGYFVHKNAKKKSLEYLKKQFVKDELPHLLKMCDLLNISINDIKDLKS